MVLSHYFEDSHQQSISQVCAMRYGFHSYGQITRNKMSTFSQNLVIARQGGKIWPTICEIRWGSRYSVLSQRSESFQSGYHGRPMWDEPNSLKFEGKRLLTYRGNPIVRVLDSYPLQALYKSIAILGAWMVFRMLYGMISLHHNGFPGALGCQGKNAACLPTILHHGYSLSSDQRHTTTTLITNFLIRHHTAFPPL